MAKIVLGIGTSHAPQLITTVEEWQLRVAADRQNPHFFRCKPVSFDDLVALRAGEGLKAHLTPDVQGAKHARNQAALDRLGEILAQAKIDVAVIVGNDQSECFSEENVAAFSVYRGESFENIPKTPEQIAKMPPGIAPTARGYCPPQRAKYQGIPELADHMIGSLMGSGFDVGRPRNCRSGRRHEFDPARVRLRVPAADARRRDRQRAGVRQHALPPNRPTAARCVAFGNALAKAIASWPEDVRVAVIASGGLTHYAIDEDFDHRVLDAMKKADFGGTRCHRRTVALVGRHCRTQELAADGVGDERYRFVDESTRLRSVLSLGSRNRNGHGVRCLVVTVPHQAASGRPVLGATGEELRTLLWPVTPETFVHEYWGKQALFVKGFPAKYAGSSTQKCSTGRSKRRTPQTWISCARALIRKPVKGLGCGEIS